MRSGNIERKPGPMVPVGWDYKIHVFRVYSLQRSWGNWWTNAKLSLRILRPWGRRDANAQCNAGWRDSQQHQMIWRLLERTFEYCNRRYRLYVRLNTDQYYSNSIITLRLSKGGAWDTLWNMSGWECAEPFWDWWTTYILPVLIGRLRSSVSTITVDREIFVL